MGIESDLSRVIIVPRNGYVNRLQAWASASILADHWGADLAILWESEKVAPAALSDLVDSSRLASSQITSSEVTDILGAPHDDLPRYLTIDPDRGLAFLAGHDRGEEVFMEEVRAAIEQGPSVSILVIVAGGKFNLRAESNFDAQRRSFYRTLPWQRTILDGVTRVADEAGTYLGMHIRETDRSREAPTVRMIERALIRFADETGVDAVFIAADTARSRELWVDRLTRLGLKPWINHDAVLDRTDIRAAQAAMTDWLTLGNARGLIYSAASSFGQEAAAMCQYPDLTLGLRAGLGLRVLRDVQRTSWHAARRLLNRH